MLIVYSIIALLAGLSKAGLSPDQCLREAQDVIANAIQGWCHDNYFDCAQDMFLASRYVQCAFPGYDFGSSPIASLAQRMVNIPQKQTPSEALAMMKACVMQNAVYEVCTLPDAKDAFGSLDSHFCSSEAWKLVVEDPQRVAKPILVDLDFDKFFKLRRTGQDQDLTWRCLGAVMNGFGKDYILKIALEEPPEPPGFMDRLRGWKQYHETWSLGELSREVPWATAWYMIKNWDIEGAKLEGWMLDSKESSITLYYISRGVSKETSFMSKKKTLLDLFIEAFVQRTPVNNNQANKSEPETNEDQLIQLMDSLTEALRQRRKLKRQQMEARQLSRHENIKNEQQNQAIIDAASKSSDEPVLFYDEVEELNKQLASHHQPHKDLILGEDRPLIVLI